MVESIGKDFGEFIGLLNKNNVEYLVVGGYAVAFHGHVRATKDIDIWVRATEENADRILTALREFGFGSVGLRVSDFIEADNIIQLGFPPNRIDILTSLTGVTFEESFKRKHNIVISGITINYIDLEGLLTNKKAVGRPRDLADVEDLT